MSAADRGSETQLPDLDTLDVQSLKALVLAKQAELDSRATEIESLKLLIVKLKRMHFGPQFGEVRSRPPTARVAAGRSGSQPGCRRAAAHRASYRGMRSRRLR